MTEQREVEDDRLIIDPLNGKVLACSFGASLQRVAARWPGGHSRAERGGLSTYSLAQDVGHCRARLKLTFTFEGDALVALTLSPSGGLSDGLGRHSYKRALGEVKRHLPSEPSFSEEAYFEYDVEGLRVSVDELDARIRIEELL